MSGRGTQSTNKIAATWVGFSPAHPLFYPYMCNGKQPKENCINL